jgi:hypothetical protein
MEYCSGEPHDIIYSHSRLPYSHTISHPSTHIAAAIPFATGRIAASAVSLAPAALPEGDVDGITLTLFCVSLCVAVSVMSVF